MHAFMCLATPYANQEKHDMANYLTQLSAIWATYT